MKLQKFGKFRVLICILLSLCLVFALTACDGDLDDILGDKITLAPSTVTVQEGKTASVQATLDGIKLEGDLIAVEWSSSDESVATVAATNAEVTTLMATVTGVKEGVATITATIGEHTATCTVTVTKASAPGPDTHVCGHVCPVENCGKCLDTDCNDPVCANKCLGHQTTPPTEEHVCGHVCPVENCGKCLDADCNDPVCANKCSGHTTPPGPGDDDKTIQVEWATVGDPVYGEVTENGADYMYHHLFINDAVAQEYDFDDYDVTVTLDGAEGEVVSHSQFAATDIEAHTYHMHIRVKGNRYQTTVLTVSFKKSGEVVAVATYMRNGDREIVLDSVMETVSIGDTVTIGVTSVNGSEDISGKAISWTIVDTEGEGVATIPADSTGSSVVVTAVAEGKATLTCTVGEGADAFTKACVITVVEGEVVIVAQDVSEKIVFNNKFTTSKEAIQIRCHLEGAEFAELVQQIDITKTTVEVTMDNEESTGNIIHKAWQASNVYIAYIQVEVASNWEHDYAFRFSFKNAKGVEVAYATYTEMAPKVLNLDNTALNLTLVAGETVTGTLTATKNDRVEGDISWTIDDAAVATIVVSDDGLSVTVTAVAKGSATITATADGLTKTCTVNVLEEGDETPVITIIDFDKFEGPYGDNRFYKFRFNGTDENASKYADIKASFDHTKVNGVATDHKEFYIGGGVDCYIVTVHFSEEPVSGTTYKIDLCDASGNILCTFSWTAA